MKHGLLLSCLLGLSFALASDVHAHDLTRLAFLRAQAVAAAQLRAEAETPRPGHACSLKLAITQDGQAVPALIRITNTATGRPVKLEAIHRGNHWYSVAERPTLIVPPAPLRIDVVRGIETRLASLEVDATEQQVANGTLSLRRLQGTSAGNWVSGNTHLHLMKLTQSEADRYLRVVPDSDDLDLVFLSHLRRIPGEHEYISNIFVENSFGGGDLARLSQGRVLFANGEEHRHNFGSGGQGYGHVMLLNLQKLIRPISIGPGIMQKGTDGRPLRTGIREARSDGATVIWCHNSFGHEDVPNWLAGLVHAQNIFDGGSQGSYEDSFYRYLNLGLRVPFSSGTDWSVYDFSRVYVPGRTPMTAEQWLARLRSGRSFISNGPLLELRLGEAELGDTVEVQPTVAVTARGVGRHNFGTLELVHNGRTIHRWNASARDGQHSAGGTYQWQNPTAGWLALRVEAGDAKNEFDKPLFAHTSPIYLSQEGETVFDAQLAGEMIAEMQASIQDIEAKGLFEDKAKKAEVLNVYREAIRELKARLAE